MECCCGWVEPDIIRLALSAMPFIIAFALLFDADDDRMLMLVLELEPDEFRF
jgi:hypothetical protein